jgi:hypothetical protein
MPLSIQDERIPTACTLDSLDLHNEHRKLYVFSNVIRSVKPRSMGCRGHAALTGKQEGYTKYKCRNLVNAVPSIPLGAKVSSRITK